MLYVAKFIYLKIYEIKKNVIKNFSTAISSMYKKNYLSLYNDDKEIKFPNWLIREIGTIKTNVKWDGNDIKVDDKNVFYTDDQIGFFFKEVQKIQEALNEFTLK